MGHGWLPNVMAGVAGATFAHFEALVKCVPPAVEAARKMEIQWAKSLIKMGKLSWLSDQEASAKAYMGKDCLAIVLHAQTFCRYSPDASVNDRHWLWDEDRVQEIQSPSVSSTRFSDFLADCVAVTCIPLSVAAELGFQLPPILERFTTVAGGVLDSVLKDIKSVMDKSKPLAEKYCLIIPAAGAQTWDAKASKDLMDNPDAENDCSEMNTCSSPNYCRLYTVSCIMYR